MSGIKERLDQLRTLIQEPDFLEGKGLSNEVNIRIFCYDATEEMIVQLFVSRLKTDLTISCRVIECNLYKIFLENCDDLGIIDSIPEIEEADGGVYLLEQLQSSIEKKDYIEKMQYNPHEKGDVLMLTGVGDVFPFMRVHALLDALQSSFSDIPILVMYPGEFDGHYLKLFNRLKPSEHYRAFNIV